MKEHFGPTLLRRIFFAALVAYAAVWMAVMGLEFFLDFRSETDDTQEFIERQSRMVERFEKAAEVAAFMESASTIYNNHPERRFYMEVWTRDGKRVFFDPQQIFPFPYPASTDVAVTWVVIDGIKYHVHRHIGARWSLRMAFPETTFAGLIRIRAGSLSLQILKCFPFLLLPILFAIMRGLLPLRLLSQRLAKRETEDLSPLHFDAKYGELKPLVAALDGLLLRLKGKIDHEHAFVQDAAHELRTPMAVISAQVHVLATVATAADKADAQQRIDHAIARATHLIRQLLELARVDGMAMQQNPLLDVVQLAKLDLAQIAPSARAREIALLIDAPPSLLHRLEQNTFLSILHNLIDNAIRYGRVGGTVAVDLKKSGDSLLLTVTDDGPGIAPAERDKVFERFYRGTGHEASGSGLGLSIVQQAATRLGAKIVLADGPHGKGCQFSVLIPA